MGMFGTATLENNLTITHKAEDTHKVISYYPERIGSRTPLDTKIYCCSSALYEMVYHLHIGYSRIWLTSLNSREFSVVLSTACGKFKFCSLELSGIFF